MGAVLGLCSMASWVSSYEPRESVLKGIFFNAAVMTAQQSAHQYSQWLGNIEFCSYFFLLQISVFDTIDAHPRCFWNLIVVRTLCIAMCLANTVLAWKWPFTPPSSCTCSRHKSNGTAGTYTPTVSEKQTCELFDYSLYVNGRLGCDVCCWFRTANGN